ncbi:MAG TPA: hypothetical protein VHR45_06955 [Thermoanaerobaculia bacterium]|nr:hypothetical protein [Thermoanaerobaculia bacterium]
MHEARRLRRQAGMACFYWLLYRLSPAAKQERFSRFSGSVLFEQIRGDLTS